MQRRAPSFRQRSRGSRDDGAALIEFALLATPLVILLFGIIESSWAFFLLSDVRHGTREGIRLVALDADPTPDRGAPTTQGERLAQETCERLDRVGNATVTIDLIDTDANGVFDVGDEAEVQVTKDFDQLTGFFDGIFGDSVISERVTSRLERTPNGVIDATAWTCA